MERLRVTGLTKKFGGIYALKDISFSVKDGEKVAIIGPNGAGKTTLLNVLSGRLFPTTGQVYISGQEVITTPEYRRVHLGLGRSFQLNSLFPSFTVLENVLLALEGTQPSRFQMFRPLAYYKHVFAKAEELLSSMDLWDKKDDTVQTTSYGEQRKLEIALSLASEPKLLLMDEPSSGLAAAEVAGLIDLIRNLGGDITVLMVAHDMDLVFEVAERIIVLHYGEIIAEGTCEEISCDSRVKEIYMGIEGNTGNAGTN